MLPVTTPTDPAATLARWEADEARCRAAMAPSGVSTPEQVAGRSGLQLLQALMAGALPSPPIGETLDFLLVEVGHGWAVFQGRPQRRHHNPMGGVHGGWYATLLDSALGCAVHSTLPAGKTYTTLEIKLNLVKALNERVARVRAEGRTVHVGSRVATAEARLVGPDGALYAHGSTTCLVMDLPAPR